MLKINVAYSERDLFTHSGHRAQAEAGKAPATVLTAETAVAWAHRSIDRLDLQYRGAPRQHDLLGHETYQMWHSPSRDAESLQQVERRVRDRLDRERDRLDGPSSTYNRMVAAVAGPPSPANRARPAPARQPDRVPAPVSTLRHAPGRCRRRAP
jgi:hypothetical protein